MLATWYTSREQGVIDLVKLYLTNVSIPTTENAWHYWTANTGRMDLLDIPFE